MKTKKSPLFMIAVISAFLFTSTYAFAEDWTISAIGSCSTELGNTSESGGGLRANGGTAVVKCPMTKEVGANTINNVYVRMRRASAFGPDSSCSVTNTPPYGTPVSLVNKSATDTTSNQSINLNLGTQSSFGYADIYCILVSGDTIFGVRYRQDN